jgi:PTH2 family peptidyl-tRNA hydrolase
MQTPTKQIIIIRKNLKMRLGKIMSQSCHSSLKVFFDRMTRNDKQTSPDGLVAYTLMVPESMVPWIEGSFTKIGMTVDTDVMMIELYNKAQEAGIPCSMIEDNGATDAGMGRGVKTLTAIAIGPDTCEKIDMITGKNTPMAVAGFLKLA